MREAVRRSDLCKYAQRRLINRPRPRWCTSKSPALSIRRWQIGLTDHPFIDVLLNLYTCQSLVNCQIRRQQSFKHIFHRYTFIQHWRVNLFSSEISHQIYSCEKSQLSFYNHQMDNFYVQYYFLRTVTWQKKSTEYKSTNTKVHTWAIRYVTGTLCRYPTGYGWTDPWRHPYCSTDYQPGTIHRHVPQKATLNRCTATHNCQHTVPPWRYNSMFFSLIVSNGCLYFLPPCLDHGIKPWYRLYPILSLVPRKIEESK